MIKKAALCLLVFACAGATVAQPPATRPGTYELTLPGSELRYTLVIPRGYRGRDAVPLIVSLHFGGPYTPFIGRSLIEQLIGPALRDLGAIVVAPDSAAGGWTSASAEQNVIELVAYVEAMYNVDPARTLLTGYSMGGMGTWYLASRHSELFEAAIPIAGQPTRESIRLDWKTPTLAINSTADELIAIEPVRAVAEALHARGAPIDMVVVDDITHFEIPRYREHLRAAIPWIERAFAGPTTTP